MCNGNRGSFASRSEMANEIFWSERRLPAPTDVQRESGVVCFITWILILWPLNSTHAVNDLFMV